MATLQYASIVGAINYKGNFGNPLFFWDVLSGTAHITQPFGAGTRW